MIQVRFTGTAFTGTAGVPPALSAANKALAMIDLMIPSYVATHAGGRDARGPSKPAVPVNP